MSRRQSIPANVFYRKADPMPPLFPAPFEGDVYFNTTREILRIFHNNDPVGDPEGGRWQDLTQDLAGLVWFQWTGTQAQYDAIAVKDPNTLYVIV